MRITVCHAFPNLICNEVPGFKLDDMCEPCQARLIVKFIAEVEKEEAEKAEKED